MDFDIIRGIVNVQNIGWEVQKCKTFVKYFPCVQVESARGQEASLLLEKNQNSKTIKRGVSIRYIGVDWKLVRKYHYIAASRWEPINLQKDNEARLNAFLRSIKKHVRFRNEPVDLKVEELAIRKMWKLVEEQQQAFELDKKTEEEERARRPPPTVSQDDNHSGATEDGKHEIDYDEDENDMGYDIAEPGVSENPSERPLLHVNDEIEFYAAEGIAGNASWIRKAKVAGVRPFHEYPLVLSTLAILPRTHHVRKLPDGFFRAIESYQLTEEGDTNVVTRLMQSVSRLKEMRDDFKQQADDFWKRQTKEKSNTDNGKPSLKRPPKESTEMQCLRNDTQSSVVLSGENCAKLPLRSRRKRCAPKRMDL